MHRWFLLFLFFLPLFTTCQNASSGEEKGIIKLSPVAFEEKMANLSEKHLVDVRTSEEFSDGHIEGALNIDYHSDQFEVDLLMLSKNKPVLVYCKSGGRSGKTSAKLLEMGFTEIYDLEGGFLLWSQLHQK